MNAIAPGTSSSPDYDPIAGFYRKHWCDHFHAGLLAALDRLLLARLSLGAHILDVCCGAGTVAHQLIARGFAVTGMDVSAETLRSAKTEVPGAVFFRAEVRAFRLSPVFHGAICTFDSLSYMLSEEDLECVFSNIHVSLRAGGIFAFDVSLEQAYKNEWHKRCSIIEDDEACFIRGSYNHRERLAHTLITRFHRSAGWERSDVEFRTRCHKPEEILRALTRSGFGSYKCNLMIVRIYSVNLDRAERALWRKNEE